MDTLYELVRIARPGIKLSPTEKEYFQLLQEGESIEEATEKIYGNTDDARIKISRLGYEIKRKIIADVATHNVKKNSNYASIATEAHQLFTTGSILMGQQAHKSGAELLEKAYQKAIQTQLIGLALECAKPLANYYGPIAGISQKFYQYQNAIEELVAAQSERNYCGLLLSGHHVSIRQ